MRTLRTLHHVKNKFDFAFIMFLFIIMLLFSVFFSISEPKAEMDYPTTIWIVQEGDSLWSIAKNNMLHDKITIQEMVQLIQSINELDDGTIFPGQEIHIPTLVEMETTS